MELLKSNNSKPSAISHQRPNKDKINIYLNRFSSRALTDCIPDSDAHIKISTLSHSYTSAERNCVSSGTGQRYSAKKPAAAAERQMAHLYRNEKILNFYFLRSLSVKVISRFVNTNVFNYTI